MDSVIVRKMEVKDIDEVLIIEKNSFTIPWTRSSFEKEIKKNLLSRYYVAIVDEAVVAYGGMWLIIDEAHVTNIAVHPDYRGRKIGKALVSYMIADGVKLGLSKMTLEVRKSNIVAQNLYKSLGFIFCGIRPGYYHDNGEDAIIMWNDSIQNVV